MAKFNTTNKVTADIVNVAGGVSYSRDSFKQELATVVLNTMVNGDSYYEKESDRLARIEAMLSNQKSDPEFLMKTAIYCRTVGNLRSITHFIAVILAENIKGHDKLRSAFTKIIERPDDALEIVALWNTRHPNVMIPNILRRAIKDVLETKFDYYQLAKYQGNRNKIKLKDIIKLSRPNPEIWWNKFGEDFEKKYS